MELPIIPSCNRCGECCIRGGECMFRGSNTKFEGRCEFLTDLPDGSTQCESIVYMERTHGKRMIEFLGIRGECTFPDWRTEIFPHLRQD